MRSDSKNRVRREVLAGQPKQGIEEEKGKLEPFYVKKQHGGGGGGEGGEGGHNSHWII